MNSERSLLHPASWRTWLALLLLALAVACGGGGVDTGGTGGAMASFATGRIEGFGSVVVNGVHYEDEQASVVDADDVVHDRRELQLGMTVEIEAGPIVRDAEGTSVSVASKIRFGSEIRGPVDSVDAAARTLRALGQTVKTDVNTVFTDVTGLSALHAGDLVQVYALFDASSGTYTATRIERQASLAAYTLRGPIAHLDTTAKTFTIGAATISYATIAAGNLPGLQDGAIARVELRTQQQAGRWVATRIATGLPVLPAIPEDKAVEIEGFVTDFKSLANFKVDGGVAVDASGAGVVFDNGTAAQLANGARIEVEGRMRNGVLVAERIDVQRLAPAPSNPNPPEKARQFELKGEIRSLNVGAKSFVVRDTTVVFDGSTEFDKGTAGDLANGRTVQVKGTLSGGNQLHAGRIKFFN
jgi:hypothetical protein